MQFPELERLLRETYIFSRVPRDEAQRVARAFAVHVFQPGETIVKRGQPTLGWHIVSSGRVRLLERADATSAVPLILGRGDTFGDHSLLEAGPSPCTVRAESTVTLLELPRAAFAELHAGYAPELRERVGARIARNAEFEFLKRLRVFSHLAPAQIEELLEILPRTSHAARAYVFREDEAADCCYLVRRGRIELLKHVDGSAKRLAARRDGDLVGEIEMLYGTPRMADARVDADADLFVVSKEVFDRFLPDGGAREVIFQLATERLLQYQNMLAAADPPADALRLPALEVQWNRIAGRLLSRRLPIVIEPSPFAAGVACLAMLDAFHRRDSPWRHRLEQLLWERRPDTLLVTSRTIEECGYFTRLVTPSVDELPSVGLPAIVAGDDGVSAVLFGMDDEGAIVGHPVRGLRHVDGDAFRRAWNGEVLVVIPADRRERLARVRDHLPRVATLAFVTLLIDLFGLGVPFAARAIVDRVLAIGDVSLLGLLLVGVLVLVGFRLLATALRDYLLAYTTRHAGLSLQRRFLDHMLRLRPGVAATLAIGDLAVRFRETEALAEQAFGTAVAAAADVAAVMLYLAALSWLGGRFALVALVFVAAYAAVSLASSPLVRRIGTRSGEARQAVQTHLIETVSGIQTLKALAAEQLVFERGRKLMMRLKAGEFSAARVTGTVELVGAALHLAAFVAMIAAGARLAAAGTATTGDIVASLGLFSALLVSLNGLIQARDGVRGIRSTSARLEELFGLETEMTAAATVPPIVQGHVVFKDVAFRYPGGSEDVLADVNLEVLPGQKVALVGRSGSGKTTLVNLLTGLLEPTRGNVYIDHVDIVSIPKSALRRQIGVVEQQPFLFEGTIRDNVAKSDPSLTLDRVVTASTLAAAHEFVLALPAGYDTPVGERGTLLSGGERQRLMIARALVGNPRMLVLDEATSAVDSGTESVIQRNLRETTEGRTTFVVAHRLSTVRNADLIVVLDRGRIVEKGTHVELMTRRGLYFYLNTRAV